MDARDLDRLVNKTELTPTSKAALRVIRKATMSGYVDGPYLSRYRWTVAVEWPNGAHQRVTFSLKRTDVEGRADNHSEG